MITKDVMIKINQGMALKQLAGIYPTLHDVILEIVQNALDVDVCANRIWIKINEKSRFISVRDNGAGASTEKFETALKSVAEPGRKGRGSIGQFGVGLISPLGKCKRFTFTSCPYPKQHGFLRWILETNRLFNQRESITIPTPRLLSHITLDKNSPSLQSVEWRTEVSLFDVTEDKIIGRVDPEELIGAILDRFGAVMRKNKVKITVSYSPQKGPHRDWHEIAASEFRGTKLAETVIETASAGKTTFRLFIARPSKNGREGRILMGSTRDDSRFPFHFLVRSSGLLTEEVVNALSSGVFEGEIISEKVQLHPNRQTFEKNDAFLDLCVAIEEWYHKHGAAHFTEAKQCRKEERYQKLGLRSLRVLEGILRLPTHAHLLSVLRAFKRGTIGDGHVTPPKKQVGDVQEKPSISVGGGAGRTREEPDGSNPRTPQEPKTEKTGHVPLTVAGPKGERRRLVSRSSFGLQFSHEALQGMKDLWKLDPQEGVLTFNTRHPSWLLCEEKSDTALMRLQEQVAMQALTLYAMPEENRLIQKQILDALTHTVVVWIVNSDKLRIHQPKKAD